MKNLEEIMVIKKDGRRVAWDANNIVRAVQKSSERAKRFFAFFGYFTISDARSLTEAKCSLA